MHPIVLQLVKAPHITLPEGYAANIQLLLRWIHFISAFTWVGLAFFLNLVNFPSVKEMEPSLREKLAVAMMPRALWWSRWSSVVVVLAGIWYWMMIVGSDARNAHASGGGAIGSFFAIWTIAFAIEMGLLMSPLAMLKQGPVFAVLVGLTVSASAYLYLTLNSHGWESNRLLAIGVGGGMGWFMLLNVWGILWRAQKKILRWTASKVSQGTPMPPETADLARMSYLVTRVNFFLAFPMLFFMAVASHYPMFGGI